MTPKPPAQNGSCVTAYSSTAYSRIWRRVSVSPRTTGSIGTPTFSYSPFISSDSAQKCGGVQKKTMKNRITAVPLTLPVVAAHATSGGPPPGAAPPPPAPPPPPPPAADDDVLRGAALEPHGVDEDVAQEAAERQA